MKLLRGITTCSPGPARRLKLYADLQDGPVFKVDEETDNIEESGLRWSRRSRGCSLDSEVEKTSSRRPESEIPPVCQGLF